MFNIHIDYRNDCFTYVYVLKESIKKHLKDIINTIYVIISIR